MAMLRPFIFVGLATACGLAWGQAKKPVPKAAAKPAAVAPKVDPDEEKMAARRARLWSLQPVKKPEVPGGATASANPIDAFIADKWREKGVKPVGKADKAALLRRVSYALTGIPPTAAEQDAFLADNSPDAYSKVVDRLLDSEQHGVRWARHWLDVLRYADADAGMPAATSIHLWREWVINALNHDMPYDEFVRAQLLGSRYKEHSSLTNTGYRVKTPGPLEDTFALGFIARAALTGDNKEQDLAMNTVETVSTAFMGMTVGCAKCHDHKFDPIRQRDFYSMKALFDPLAVRTVPLATAPEIFANGRAVEEYRKKKEPIDAAIENMVAGYRKRLYDERVADLPVDVQVVIRKPEKQRTAAEQKIFDDYFPILRIDASKIREVMTKDEVAKYNDLLKQQSSLAKPPALPVWVTVEEDSDLIKQPSYILNTGDPMRPEKDKPVQPGFPFKPESVDFREGRREGFADWLTGHDNPLFARVAVNRIWAWHFGEGLHRNTSDFGVLGSTPTNQKLLDYLAAEFVEHNYSMKWLHRLIVTSDTYQLASQADAATVAANTQADARNSYLWHFRLQRLEAEPIWDTILYVAGDLDQTVGGKSFSILKPDPKKPAPEPENTNRRAAYMRRGYIPSTDVMANFLQSFDVDDGRAPCPIRTQTVTAPQALFTMNDDLIEKETGRFAEKVMKEAGGDVRGAVTLAYRAAIGRAPTAAEADRALTYLDSSGDRMKGLAWLIFNLDEFIYVR